MLAATIGPLANVLSIAALVSKWRVKLPNNGQLPEGTDDAGENIPGMSSLYISPFQRTGVVQYSTIDDTKFHMPTV